MKGIEDEVEFGMSEAECLLLTVYPADAGCGSKTAHGYKAFAVTLSY